MGDSKIEWTDTTWNPVTGCDKISPGCKHCYAETMAHRLKAMGVKNYRDGFKVTLHPHMLDKPHTWKKPRMVFVNSMSDLFHRDVPFDFIEKVFQVMEETPRHIYQVLTKRPDMMPWSFNWTDNIWLGVSVEDPDYKFRIDILRECPAKHKFLSLEPLLEPLGKLDLSDIEWVIVGGESGPGARPMKSWWVTDIRDQCLAQGVPFFFKQWGGVQKKKNGRLLDGRIWDGMPDAMNLKKEAHSMSEYRRLKVQGVPVEKPDI